MKFICGRFVGSTPRCREEKGSCVGTLLACAWPRAGDGYVKCMSRSVLHNVT